MQSQVKPSHCCRQTPWLAQDSSVQVVLGPGRGRRKEHPLLSQAPSSLRSYGSFGARPRGLALRSAGQKGPRTDGGGRGMEGELKDC